MSRAFASVADKIQINNFPDLVKKGNVGITYAAQINPTGFGNSSNGRIVDQSDPASGKGHAFFLSSGSGGQITARISKSGADAQAVGAFPSTLFNNEWKYVAMSYLLGDTGPRIFLGTTAAKMVEMAYVSRVDGSGSVVDVTAFPFLLGNSGAGGNAFQGRIQDVTTWIGALNLASLEKLRQFPTAVVFKFGEATLQAHWALADIEKTATLRDLSGNNFPAVAVGTTPDHQVARETQGSSGW